MSRDDSNPSSPNPSSDAVDTDLRYRGYTRQVDDSRSAGSREESAPKAASVAAPRRRGALVRLLVAVFVLTLIVAIAAAAALFYGRKYVGNAMRENLPQLDGTLAVDGLTAPVTVARDARGVPYIRATSMDDLIFAQGYVTAQDRLWQMDLLRRHAAGELAAILGRPLLDHDRLQRTLQLRASAERAIAVLPADQLHWLDVYARGVNASIAEQSDHLPVEFRLLHYRPEAWTPRDSILIELVMFQDLTTDFPTKLAREALAAHLPPELIADLYPTGSWRDHYPGQPIPDLTAPQPEIPDIPLDESQTQLRRPSAPSIPRTSRNGWESSIRSLL